MAAELSKHVDTLRRLLIHQTNRVRYTAELNELTNPGEVTGEYWTSVGTTGLPDDLLIQLPHLIQHVHDTVPELGITTLYAYCLQSGAEDSDVISTLMCLNPDAENNSDSYSDSDDEDTTGAFHVMNTDDGLMLVSHHKAAAMRFVASGLTEEDYFEMMELEVSTLDEPTLLRSIPLNTCFAVCSGGESVDMFAGISADQFSAVELVQTIEEAEQVVAEGGYILALDQSMDNISEQGAINSENIRLRFSGVADPIYMPEGACYRLNADQTDYTYMPWTVLAATTIADVAQDAAATNVELTAQL